MITKFKIFENNNTLEIYLGDIYSQSPWYNENKQSLINDYDFITELLNDYFLNKYVKFEHSYFLSNKMIIKSYEGIVKDIMYDNEYWSDKIVYFQLEKDGMFYSVKEDVPIIVDFVKTDTAKYNL